MSHSWSSINGERDLTHLRTAVGPPSPYLKASSSAEPQTLQDLELDERVRSRGKILQKSLARGEIKVSIITTMNNIRHYKTMTVI